jgi:hypothetical protein
MRKLVLAAALVTLASAPSHAIVIDQTIPLSSSLSAKALNPQPLPPGPQCLSCSTKVLSGKAKIIDGRFLVSPR